MYKLSHYHIVSDSVDNHSGVLFFSTKTSKLLKVSANTHFSLNNKHFHEIPANILDTLIDAKIVVAENEDELAEIVAENKNAIAHNTDLYEVIQPSANCQLGCYYCGQDHTKTSISQDVNVALLERIRNKVQTQKYQHLSIGWFGGEPLMALQQIRELTPKLKALSNEFGMSYSAKIVTNGLSLKESIFVELVQKLGVNSIEITLDGTAEFHDKHRYTKEGGKSFDLIFKNLLAICTRPDFEELGCKVSVRCNVDRKNWEGVSPLIQLLAKHELHKKIAYFYPIGIYSWAGNEAHADSLTKEEFAEKEIDWLIEMFEAGFTPNLLPNRVKDVCIAVSPTSEMYDTYGNIFNCTEVSLTDFYQNTPYTLGNLKKEPKAHNQVFRPLSDWNDTLLENMFPCHTCKMLPVCGGGCPKSWHEDMRACPTPKFNIKNRLALAYVASKANIKDLAKV